MKKNLIAAALVAAAGGGAAAQSSLTLFGTVDATLAVGHGSVSNKVQLANSGYSSSAIGFRGVEDLGGGMSASFWLEAAVNNDNGTGSATNTNNQASGGAPSGAAGGQGLTFNRRSTISLSGRWGELRLGRDYTAHYWNHVIFDPFGNKGVGTSQAIGSSLAGLTGVRASNVVGYFLPALGGVYGQYQHFLSENASGSAASNDGNGDALRLGYESGALNIAIAAARVKYAAGDIATSNVGGAYNFGVAKLSAVYDRDHVDRGAAGRGWLVGAEVPSGAGTVRASYSTYKTDALAAPASTKLALGYVYHLSKRTTVYAAAARVNNKGSAAVSLNGSVTAAGQRSSGFDLGIAHRF